MAYREREPEEGASYVDVLLRTYLKAIATEGPASACRHMDLVQHAWRLIVGSRDSVRRAKVIFKEKIAEFNAPENASLLDAYPPESWLDIAFNICISEKMKVCKGPHAKYFSFCLHREYRDVVLSDPRERIEPWCCSVVADIVLQLADERGYGRLALQER